MISYVLTILYHSPYTTLYQMLLHVVLHYISRCITLHCIIMHFIMSDHIKSCSIPLCDKLNGMILSCIILYCIVFCYAIWYHISLYQVVRVTQGPGIYHLRIPVDLDAKDQFHLRAKSVTQTAPGWSWMPLHEAIVEISWICTFKIIMACLNGLT